MSERQMDGGQQESQTEMADPLREAPARGVRNELSGTVVGPSVQASTVYGGMHFHQVASVWPPPRQLPPQPVHFTGREEERQALADILADRADGGKRLAVVSGPGGIGKTALALETLYRSADQFPDGQLYADLGGADGRAPAAPGEVLGRFLRALGVASDRVPVELAEQVALYRSLTRTARLQVLADNAMTAAQVRALVPASADSVTVVTTRWRLGALASDGARYVWLDPLSAEQGVRLLERVLNDGRVRADPAAAERLVDMCGRFPVAVVVAAARLVTRPRWPIRQLVAAVADERRRLGGLGRDDDVLRSVFDASVESLSPEAARLYRLLSWHPGTDFSLDLAVAASGGDTDACQLELSTLVESNLLDELTIDRYRFHDLIALHARTLSRAVDGHEHGTAVRAMAEYYLRTADLADRTVMPDRRPRLPREYLLPPSPAPVSFDTTVAALDWLEAEMPNLEATMVTAKELGWNALVVQLADALWSLFVLRKLYRTWLRVHQLAMAAASDDPAAQVMLGVHLGMAHHERAQPEPAMECFTAALATARRTNNPLGQASALHSMGLVMRTQRRFAEAADHFRASADLQTQAGSWRAAAINRLALGRVYLEAGDFDAAIADLTTAKNSLAEMRDSHNEARADLYLATARIRSGNAAEAMPVLRAALDASIHVGAPLVQAQVLTAMGEAEEATGDRAGAAESYRAALNILTGMEAPETADVADRLRRLTGQADPP